MLHLTVLGDLPADLTQALTARLSRQVALPCRVGSLRKEADLPRLATRNQLDADALLASLEQEARSGPDGVLVVGVTALDLGIPIFTFIFGRARQGGRAALVSLTRLDPAFYGLPADLPLLLHRAVIEILHELGHVAGLPHCRDFQCLMHFAASVESIDARGNRFCQACGKQLPGWLRSAIPWSGGGPSRR